MTEREGVRVRGEDVALPAEAEVAVLLGWGWRLVPPASYEKHEGRFVFHHPNWKCRTGCHRYLQDAINEAIALSR